MPPRLIYNRFVSIKKRALSFLYRNKTDLLICLFLSLFLPLFFYNLGGYSLEDFDEAWYGEIARNILINRNPLVLTFNGSSYLDHPPLGFLLMAISIFLFDANEFAVRFPSALLGFLSVILIYFIGKNLFSRKAGLVSALGLVSCIWFIFRARSGNLDTILTFFYLLTFYFAVKLKQNLNNIFPLAISFALLMLTKSVIGATILFPIAVFIPVNKIKIPLSKILLALLLFFATLTPWFFASMQAYGPSFLEKQIGTGTKSSYIQSVNYPELLKSQTFTYLHYGVGKWYYPALIAFILCLFLSLKNKNLIPILAWTTALIYAFIHNSKTEIWHLLPLYIPLLLLIGFVYIYVIERALKLPIVTLISIVPVLAISLSLILSFKNNVRLADKQKSPLSQTALAAKNYTEPLYLDSDLSVPAVAAFYSQKQVQVVKNNPPGLNTLNALFNSARRPFILITEKWRLLAGGIKPSNYKILLEDRGHLLVLVD